MVVMMVPDYDLRIIMMDDDYGSGDNVGIIVRTMMVVVIM